MKRTLLMAFMTLFMSYSAVSQTYTYGGNGVENLTVDPHSKVIHFTDHTALVLFEAKAPNTIQIVKKISKYNALIIESESELPDDIRIVSNLENIDIAHQTPVFKLADGFQLWLSYQMVFEPKSGFENEIRTLANHYGSELSQNEYGMWIAHLSDPMLTLAISNEMNELGYVKYAEPDFYVNHANQDDPYYTQQFQLNNIGQFANGVTGIADYDCNAPEAWEITSSDASIIVAVIDDGVELHEDITNDDGTTRILPGFTPATNGDGTPNGNNSHGMACAGIIAASHNEIGIKGVAPNVQILPINVFQGSETTSDIAVAFNYARTQGADIISNSWNYNSCTYSSSTLNNAIYNATNNGRNGLGCVVVFSSGNGYKTCVDYPADLTNVMGVGSVTSVGTHSNYSNQGPALDVVAPSSAASGQLGANVSTTDRPGTAGYSYGNYTNTFGGTSAACPVVAGVAALILSVNSNLEESDVREIIMSTATDMGETGFDNLFGHGRVNAYAAVLMALPASECLLTSPSTPYLENFEADFSNWTQLDNDQLDWTQISGSTPSTFTGANQAFSGTEYLFIESSYPNYYNKSAKIESPCIDISSLDFPVLQFAAHMYGAAIGTLKIEASSDDENWSTIFSISGNQGNTWNESTVSLIEFLGTPHLRLRITGQTGDSYTGDICIDALSISDGDEGLCDEIISYSPYLEGFENISNSWHQSQNDDINWTRRFGMTPSMSTGPLFANEGLFYMYIESSKPNSPGKTAILESDCIDLSSAGNNLMSFNYHMYGNDTGSLKLRAKSGDQTWTTLWSAEGNLGNEWFEAIIDLSSFNGLSDVVFQFVGTTGPSFRSDIAIDFIEIYPAQENSAEVNQGEFFRSTNYNPIDSTPRIYPNPTNNLLTIQLNSQKPVQISVRSLTGQTLKEYSGITNQVQISLGDLANGLYLVDVRSGNKILGIQKVAKTQ